MKLIQKCCDGKQLHTKCTAVSWLDDEAINVRGFTVFDNVLQATNCVLEDFARKYVKS